MLTKRNAGLTEFIPTPQEKRDGLIRDHVLELVSLLHERLSAIEGAETPSSEQAYRCHELLRQIAAEEMLSVDINRQLLACERPRSDLASAALSDSEPLKHGQHGRPDEQGET